MFKNKDAWLVGYYGMQNCGDDALLLATMYGAKHYLDCQKLAVASVGDIHLSDHTNVTATLRKDQDWRGQNRLTQYKNALTSRRVIFGGGSVFHTATDINQKRHLIRLSNARNSMALGVSLGPFANAEAEVACQQFLNECGFIALRDKQSYDLAKSLAPNANLRLTFDLAVMLTNHPEFKVNQGERHGILFNVCPVAKDAFGTTDPFEEEQRVREMCQVIEAIWKRTGERITLISLNGNQQTGDVKITQMICDELRARMPISAIPYNPNPLKVINVISHFKVMVSMRLHGNIFAYMSKTPSIAINYHPKCEQWCEQIELPASVRFDANNIPKRRLFGTMVKGLERGFPMAQLPIETATELSELNWRTQDARPQILSRHPALQ